MMHENKSSFYSSGYFVELVRSPEALRQNLVTALLEGGEK
jgi:hypothetical protein